MSGKAATEIAEIVEKSLGDANLITEENKNRVDQGSVYVNETAGALVEISNSSDLVSDGANQVLSASKEQGIGIKQINMAMSQLDKATQENAATAEQTASMSEELGGQTETLNETVKDMVLLVGTNQKENRVSQEHVELEVTKKSNLIQLQKPTTAKPTLKKAVGSKDENFAEDEWEKL